MRRHTVIASPLFFALIFLASCGLQNTTSRLEGAKPLFSSWTKSPGASVLDLSNSSIGTSSLLVTFVTGEECFSQLVVAGNEASGTAVVSLSTYISGSGSGNDPACAALNGVFSYTKTENTLTLCQAGGTCSTYR